MKQFRLMILVTAAILIFSGCTKLELDYVIEENGTVSTTYLIAVEDQAGKLADIQHLIDAPGSRLKSWFFAFFIP